MSLVTLDSIGGEKLLQRCVLNKDYLVLFHSFNFL